MRTSSHTELLVPAKKAAVFGILGALALILSLLDSMLTTTIPVFPVGVKPGLSNIAATIAAFISPAGGFFILTIKVVFTLATRGLSAAAMSFSGGILAVSATTLLVLAIKRSEHINKRLSYIGICVLSAALHSMGQLLCAGAMSGTAQLLSYGKYLLLFSIISGFLTGVVLNIIMPRIAALLSSQFSKR